MEKFLVESRDLALDGSQTFGFLQSFTVLPQLFLSFMFTFLILVAVGLCLLLWGISNTNLWPKSPKETWIMISILLLTFALSCVGAATFNSGESSFGKFTALLGLGGVVLGLIALRPLPGSPKPSRGKELLGLLGMGYSIAACGISVIVLFFFS